MASLNQCVDPNRVHLKSHWCGMKPSVRSVKKMELMIKEYNVLYEEMAEAQAEGKAGGFTDKSSGCRFHSCVVVVDLSRLVNMLHLCILSQIEHSIPQTCGAKRICKTTDPCTTLLNFGIG